MSTLAALRQAAGRFTPPYQVAEGSGQGLRIRLTDPTGRRPDLTLRHRQQRRPFLRANYLVVEADVPGAGPAEDGELAFRFRGPLSRQRASVRWRSPLPGGEEWLAGSEQRLLRGAGAVEALQALRVRWHAAAGTWHLYLETMSGSVVTGFLAPLPVAVPIDRSEVDGILELLDALAGDRA